MYDPPIPQTDDAITLMGHAIGRRQNPPEFALFSLHGIFVQQTLGKVDEPGIQRLLAFRNRRFMLPKLQVVEHLASRGFQLWTQPIDILVA